MSDGRKFRGLFGLFAKKPSSAASDESTLPAPAAPPSSAAISPSVTDLINEGLLHRQQFGTEAALPFFERASKAYPHSHLPSFMLGNAAAELGDLDAAVVHYARARDIRPNDHVIRYNLGLTHLWRGYVDAAILELDAARRIEPSYLPAKNSFLLALHNSERIRPEELAEAIREIGALFPAPDAPVIGALPSDLHVPGSLRVGFVSGDFRTHSVAHFFEPILTGRRRGEFEYICYSNCAQQDMVTARLRAAADKWRDVWTLSDDALMEQIRTDRVDILVDLSGYTEFNRLALFARRAAPVQITYLGFPNSTGISAMDYRVTDSVTDPSPSADVLYSETLLRMPETQWCFRPFGTPIEPGPLPARENGFVTFGSFNNLMKVSDTLLRCWTEILIRLPKSRLRITRVRSPQRAAEIVDFFEGHGISPARIECIAYRTDVPHGLQFAGVDIALDHFPYNGVTTTCESLHLGVPVVSMHGENCVSRSGLSILGSVGLRDLVGVSPQEYVRIAVALGGDLDRLEALRFHLRDRFEHSALRDERRFAADFEELLRLAWKKGGRHQTVL
jgi:tetratricopeptide (TPR) repeat protein